MAIVTVKVSVDYYFRLEEDGFDPALEVRREIEENGIETFLEDNEDELFCSVLGDVSK